LLGDFDEHFRGLFVEFEEVLEEDGVAFGAEGSVLKEI